MPIADPTPIAVLIINYKTAGHVAAGLDGLSNARQQLPGLRAYVVDNHSGDDSVNALQSHVAKQRYQEWVEIIAHDQNGGFAAGNNVAIRRARANPAFKPAYFYFLNPDAFVDEQTLPLLLEWSRQRQDRALIGSTLVDEHGTARASSFRYPSLASEFQRGASLGMVAKWVPSSSVSMPPSTQPHQADWVSGAGFWLPAPIIDTVGEMDEGYFLYFEEVDYMRAIKRSGFEVWSLPSSRIMHIGGAATGISRGKSLRSRMPVYWYQSWRRYFTKNHGVLFATACGLLWLLGAGVNRLLSIALPHRRNQQGPKVKDFVMYALLGKR